MRAVFRCDATADIGFGHISRCIALAEALQLYGVSCTIAGQFDEAAERQIDAAKFSLISLDQPVNSDTAKRELAAITSKQPVEFLVIDSYRADDHYISGLGKLEQKTVVIDDFRKLERYDCDVVLNFTWEAPKLGYPIGPELLLGPKFLLVRRGLVDAREESLRRPRGGPVRNLLVAIGGSDPKGITARIVRILSAMDLGICVHAIAPVTDELTERLNMLAEGSALVPRQPDLSDELLWADAAITGGGLIKYECAHMGIPAAAIAQNDGQDGETQVLSSAGLVFDLGLADSTTDEGLAHALSDFIKGSGLRSNLARRMRDTFIPDPTVHAAEAILEAIGR